MKKSIQLLVAVSFVFISHSFCQSPQFIQKFINPTNKFVSYIPSRPLMIDGGTGRNFIITLKFGSDPATGDLKEIEGFQLFANGMGKCFFQDTLQLTLASGKIIRVGSSSPEFCDMQLVGWFYANKSDRDSLFASPVKQFRFENKKTGAVFEKDISLPADQTYFMDLKKVFDTLPPVLVEPSQH